MEVRLEVDETKEKGSIKYHPLRISGFDDNDHTNVFKYFFEKEFQLDATTVDSFLSTTKFDEKVLSIFRC